MASLLATDLALTGRWDYLATCWESGALPDAPIPLIHFQGVPDKAAWKMLTASLEAIPLRGASWQGWSSWTYFRYFLEWLLHGFHHPGQPLPPEEPSGCAGASDRLGKVFDIALLVKHPYDYFGDLLAQNAYGKGQGFFPNPHHVCEFMTQMLMAGSEHDERRNTDTRVFTVCDPCVGTGRLLLHASNHSLRLYEMDIDQLLCQGKLVNCYLFAPWLVRPLPFLDAVQYDAAQRRSVREHGRAGAAPSKGGSR